MLLEASSSPCVFPVRVGFSSDPFFLRSQRWPRATAVRRPPPAFSTGTAGADAAGVGSDAGAGERRDHRTAARRAPRRRSPSPSRPPRAFPGRWCCPAATIPAGDTLTVTTTTTLPAGLPALSAGRRVRSTSSGLEVLYYQGVQFTQTVTFPAFPAFTIALPAGYNTSEGVFELAFYDGNGWTYPLGAAGVPNGQTLSFSGAPGPVTYQANRPYYFALYYAPTPPSPTPTPTATPVADTRADRDARARRRPRLRSPTPTPTPTPGPLDRSTERAELPRHRRVARADRHGQQLVLHRHRSARRPAPTRSRRPSRPSARSARTARSASRRKPPGACTIDVSDATNRHTAVSVTVATSSLTVKSRKH